MYAILHESIYLRGEGVSGPSNWSAERVLSDDPEVRLTCDICHLTKERGGGGGGDGDGGSSHRKYPLPFTTGFLTFRSIHLQQFK